MEKPGKWDRMISKLGAIQERDVTNRVGWALWCWAFVIVSITIPYLNMLTPFFFIFGIYLSWRTWKWRGGPSDRT